ncbi:hypothetical protein [Parasphingorhabdus sp.]|uniref:hypothetical protein n=1 Tax=Parasphingorhabdus sp. TaxID=2709688 RepID=UPI003A9500A1
MPATASRIGFITSDVRRATAGPDASVEAKYGKLARDTKEPVETFFDLVVDAQIMADERLLLLKAERRLIEFAVSGIEAGVSLDFSGTTPSVTRTVPRYNLSDTAAVVKVEVDYQNNVTTLETWG